MCAFKKLLYRWWRYQSGPRSKNVFKLTPASLSLLWLWRGVPCLWFQEEWGKKWHWQQLLLLLQEREPKCYRFHLDKMSQALWKYFCCFERGSRDKNEKECLIWTRILLTAYSWEVRSGKRTHRKPSQTTHRIFCRFSTEVPNYMSMWQRFSEITINFCHSNNLLSTNDFKKFMQLQSEIRWRFYLKVKARRANFSLPCKGFIRWPP